MATDDFRMEAIFSLQVIFPAVRMMQQDILRIYDGKYLFNKNKFYFKNLGYCSKELHFKILYTDTVVKSYLQIIVSKSYMYTLLHVHNLPVININTPIVHECFVMN